MSYQIVKRIKKDKRKGKGNSIIYEKIKDGKRKTLLTLPKDDKLFIQTIAQLVAFFDVEIKGLTPEKAHNIIIELQDNENDVNNSTV